MGLLDGLPIASYNGVYEPHSHDEFVRQTLVSDNPGRILVVDDNEMNRDMLSRRLQRQNHEVTVAEDGKQALDMVKAAAFDLILLDIMMPNLNGYDVLTQLKQDPITQRIPVIMISAVDELDSVVKCIELGAEDYLFKPFNPVLLKARVNASLQKHRQFDAVRVQASLAAIQAEVDTLRATTPTPLQTQHLDVLTTQLRELTSLLNKMG